MSSDPIKATRDAINTYKREPERYYIGLNEDRTACQAIAKTNMTPIEKKIMPIAEKTLGCVNIEIEIPREATRDRKWVLFFIAEHMKDAPNLEKLAIPSAFAQINEPTDTPPTTASKSSSSGFFNRLEQQAAKIAKSFEDAVNATLKPKKTPSTQPQTTSSKLNDSGVDESSPVASSSITNPSPEKTQQILEQQKNLKSALATEIATGFFPGLAGPCAIKSTSPQGYLLDIHISTEDLEKPISVEQELQPVPPLNLPQLFLTDQYLNQRNLHTQFTFGDINSPSITVASQEDAQHLIHEASVLATQMGAKPESTLLRDCLLFFTSQHLGNLALAPLLIVQNGVRFIDPEFGAMSTKGKVFFQAVPGTQNQFKVTFEFESEICHRIRTARPEAQPALSDLGIVPIAQGIVVGSLICTMQEDSTFTTNIEDVRYFLNLLP